MSDFNFNLNMCSTLCSVQEQENDSGPSLRRGAPAPWLATHSAQSQRNLLVAKMAESQTLDRQARKSAERDFEGSRLNTSSPSKERRRNGRKIERESPMAFSNLLRGQLMAIGSDLVTSTSSQIAANADMLTAKRTSGIDGADDILSCIRSKVKANLYGTDASTFFHRYDTDHSGSFDFEEFRMLMRKTLKIPVHEVSDFDIHSLLHALDEDGSGDLDIDEFVEFINNGCVGLGTNPPTNL